MSLVDILTRFFGGDVAGIIMSFVQVDYVRLDKAALKSRTKKIYGTEYDDDCSYYFISDDGSFDIFSHKTWKRQYSFHVKYEYITARYDIMDEIRTKKL